jgi:hypothetical protein
MACRNENPTDTLNDWADYVTMYYGRGVQLKEWYITPKMMTDEHWKILGQATRWAEKHAETLSNSTVVGLRADDGNAYGYLSVAGDGQKVTASRYNHGESGKTVVSGSEAKLGMEPVEPPTAYPAGRWQALGYDLADFSGKTVTIAIAGNRRGLPERFVAPWPFDNPTSRFGRRSMYRAMLVTDVPTGIEPAPAAVDELVLVRIQTRRFSCKMGTGEVVPPQVNAPKKPEIKLKRTTKVTLEQLRTATSAKIFLRIFGIDPGTSWAMYYGETKVYELPDSAKADRWYNVEIDVPVELLKDHWHPKLYFRREISNRSDIHKITRLQMAVALPDGTSVLSRRMAAKTCYGDARVWHWKHNEGFISSGEQLDNPRFMFDSPPRPKSK